jgi:Tol biopolymer transport system component
MTSVFLLVALVTATSVPPRDHIIAQPGAPYLLATTTVTDDGFLLIDVATGAVQALSFGNITHVFGDFSPDGCQIVFSLEQRPNSYDLFVANIDGSGLRQVMFPGRLAAINYRAFEPDWSPDGTRIAFTFMRYYDPPDEDPYRRTHIATVPATGGAPDLYSTSGYEFNPRWSPDGSQLAYVSEQPILFDTDGSPVVVEEGDEDEVPRYPEIWLGNIAGTEKRRLTNLGEIGAFNPRWSPDGRWLAYVIQPYENSHRLLVNNLETGSILALNRDLVTVLDYDWRQDSARIAASMQGMQDVPQNRLWQLNIVHHDDTNARPLATTEAYMDYPRYSPDGRWLALRSQYELTVLQTGSDSIQHMGMQTRHNSPPAWSPASCNHP